MRDLQRQPAGDKPAVDLQCRKGAQQQEAAEGEAEPQHQPAAREQIGRIGEQADHDQGGEDRDPGPHHLGDLDRLAAQARQAIGLGEMHVIGGQDHAQQGGGEIGAGQFEIAGAHGIGDASEPRPTDNRIPRPQQAGEDGLGILDEAGRNARHGAQVIMRRIPSGHGFTRLPWRLCCGRGEHHPGAPGIVPAGRWR